MLTSRGFTLLASSVNTWVVYQLLMSGDFHSIIRKCIYSNPNYGPCWFKVKTCPVFTAGEVILQSLRAVAWEVSSHNDLYLNAIRQSASRQKRKDKACYRYFTHAFQPDCNIAYYRELSTMKKLVMLFGTCQIDASSVYLQTLQMNSSFRCFVVSSYSFVSCSSRFFQSILTPFS